MKSRRRIKLVLGLFAALVILRQYYYNYDTGADYLYRFDDRYATMIAVEVKNHTVQLPELENTHCTAFLEINLGRSVFGYLWQPQVQLWCDSIRILHSFEYGAGGIRYLNVSEFVRRKARTISCESWNCTVADGLVKLIVYHDQDLRNERVLVLAPHPDDAEIAAYGVYRSTPNVWIATITAGDAGNTTYENYYTTKREHYLMKGKLRVWNSITVPLLAGVPPQHIMNLGYFDSTLQRMYYLDTVATESKYSGTTDISMYRSKNISALLLDTSARSTWRSLVNDEKNIVQRIRPSVIITPYPAIDAHNDHKYTSIALFQALKELHDTDTELWMYTNHYTMGELYPSGEMGSAISLPPSFRTPGIFFNRIYSHSLSRDIQIEKLFALDAMIDLRDGFQWSSLGDLLQVIWLRMTDDVLQHENNYYRKSVRSNELFFVVRSSELSQDVCYTRIIGIPK